MKNKQNQREPSRGIQSVNLIIKQNSEIIQKYNENLRRGSKANSLRKGEKKMKQKNNNGKSLKQIIQTEVMIIQTLLLMMGIDIKYNSYQQAKQQFYLSLTRILQSIKLSTIYYKKYKISSRQKDNEIQRPEKMTKQFYVLMIIGLLNNQRMLLQTNAMKGWQIGFNIIKKIDKEYKFQQNGWGKYIRTQYQNFQYLTKNKNYYQEIRLIFVPFIIHECEAIRNLLVNNRQFLCNGRLGQNQIINTIKQKRIAQQMKYRNCMQLQQQKNQDNISRKYSRDRDKSQILSMQKQQKYLITYNNLRYKLSPSKYINSRRTNNVSKFQLEKENNITDSSRQKNLRGESKKKLKVINKYPSIDWLSSSVIPDSQFLNSILLDNIQSINRSELNQAKVLTFRPKKVSKQKQTAPLVRKTKKKTLHMLNFSINCSNNTTEEQIQSRKDNILKINKEIVKCRKKNQVIHKLIGDQQSKQFGFDQNIMEQVQISTNECKAQKMLRAQQSRQNKKSIQINIMQELIKLLVKNKKKLKINLLVEKYQLARKRKKTRNYQNQMLEFELQKNIAHLVINYSNKNNIQNKRQNLSTTVPNFSSINYRSNQTQKTKNLSTIIQNYNKQRQLQNLLYTNKYPYQKSQNKKQQILETSYRKSKQAIRQMLKKVTSSTAQYNKKQNIKKSFLQINSSFQNFLL